MSRDEREPLVPPVQRDEGFTTAETAIALPALVLVLTVVAVLLGGVLDQIRCVDAARLGARSLARGDTAAVATKLAENAAPEGSSVEVEEGRKVTVVVHGPERRLTKAVFRARAVATAPDESVGITGRRLGSLPVSPTAIPEGLT